MAKAAKKPKYERTNAEYAKEYGCSIKSITRYKAKGFPLDDHEAMQEILASQKK